MSSAPSLTPKEIKDLLSGSFTHPPPTGPACDVQYLHLALGQLLNFLSIDWYRPPAAELFVIVGAESDVTGAFGQADVVIGIRNLEKKVTKEILQRISDHCKTLYSFLLYDIGAPSLRVVCGLTTNIACYIDTYVTPKGITSMHRSFRSDQPQQLSIMMRLTPMYDFFSLGEWLNGFIRRLNLACDPQLMLSIRSPSQDIQWTSIDWQATQWGTHRRFPGLIYDRGGTVKIGQLFLKFCKNCTSCRIQSTKAKPILVGGYNFEIRVAVMQCIPAIRDVVCANDYFSGSLTVLGPGSLPVLPEPGIQPWISQICDWGSFGMSTSPSARSDKKHVCDASVALQNSNSNLHLLLVFQCVQPATEATINDMMHALRENCFMVLGNHLTALKTAVNRCMGKFYKNKEKASAHRDMVMESSRRLADGISEIVRLSDNIDFKDSVSQFFPHSDTNELKSEICDKAIKLGQKAFNIPAEETCPIPTTHETTTSEASPPSTQPLTPIVDDFDEIVEEAHPSPGTPRQSKRRRIEEVQADRFLSKQSGSHTGVSWVGSPEYLSKQSGSGGGATSSHTDWTTEEEESISFPEIIIKSSSDFDDLGSEEYNVLYQNEKLGPVESVTPTKGFEDKDSNCGFKVAGIHIYSQEKDDFDLLDDV